MVKAYTPISSDIPPYILPPQPSESVIEKDKEFFLMAHRYAFADGALHNEVFYTVPAGQTLFIEHVSFSGMTNSNPGSGIAAWCHITALGTYIGGVDISNLSTVSAVNHYPTPIKLLTGEQINCLLIAAGAGLYIAGIVIVSGYLLSNF